MKLEVAFWIKLLTPSREWEAKRSSIFRFRDGIKHQKWDISSNLPLLILTILRSKLSGLWELRLMLGQNWEEFSKEAKWMWKWLPLTETCGYISFNEREILNFRLIISAKCSSRKNVIAHLSHKITSEYLHLYQMLTRSWYWIYLFWKVHTGKCFVTPRCLPTSLRYPTPLIETCCQVRKYHKITIFWELRQYVERTITISISLS